MTYKGLKIALNDIKFLSQFWGIFHAINIRLVPYFLSKIGNKSYHYIQSLIIVSYLKKDFSDIIESYKTKIKSNKPQPITKKTPIWICWWQGEDKMPPLIRKCYTIILNNSNGHPVNLITKNNYKRYIKLPKKTIERLNNNDITLTFLSDVIRMELLAKHGGIWIDSTYWITRPLDFYNMEFFTIRQDCFKTGETLNDFRWTPHLIGSGSPYYVFQFIRDCLERYLILHKTNVVYLLIDYIIYIAYEQFADFKEYIDNLTDTKPHIYIMPSMFNKEFNEKEMVEIVNSTPWLKLTLKWREEFIPLTNDDKLTFYGYFLNL